MMEGIVQLAIWGVIAWAAAFTVLTLLGTM